MTIDYRPALPYILLEKNDASSYTFDPFTPTYNFSLQDLRFTPPKDLMGGEFEMTIMGSGATNAQANTILSNISEGNTVTIYVGKTNAGKVKLFYGVIETIEVKEDNKNMMQITLSGPDWGSNLLKHRIVSDSWIQKKDTADQTQLDDTDDNVLIYTIAKALLDDSSGSYPDRNYPLPIAGDGVLDFGVTVNSTYCQPPNIRLSQFEANFERVDDKLAELDEIGNTIHFIDPDKNFVMRDRDYIIESGLLFIDDHTSATATGWTQTKLGYIAPGSIYKKTVEGHRRRIFGLGAGRIAIDQQSTDTTGSTLLSAGWIAQRFTPTYGSCYNIGVYLSGASSADLTLYLAEDIGGLPGGTLRAVNLNKNTITSAGAWVYLPIGEVVVTGTPYWILLSSDAGTAKWHHNNTDFGASTQMATSSDGSTWVLATSNRYTYAFIEYTNDQRVVILPPNALVTNKHFWEDVIHRTDINDGAVLRSYVNGLYTDTIRRKEIFTCNIRCPDTIPQIGHRVRVVKSASGYVVDDFFTIRGITYIFESSDDKQTGTYHFKVELVKMSVFT